MLGTLGSPGGEPGAFGRGALDYLAGTQAGRSFYQSGPASPAPPAPAGRQPGAGGSPAPASGLAARGEQPAPRREDRAGGASTPPPRSATPSSTPASSGGPDWTVDWGPRGPPPGQAAASPEPLLGPAGVRVPDLLSLRAPERPGAEAGATPVGQPSSSRTTVRLDATSYIAGEKAALEKAIRYALPSNQALAALSNSLEHLEAQCRGHAARVRACEDSGASGAHRLASLEARLDMLQAKADGDRAEAMERLMAALERTAERRGAVGGALEALRRFLVAQVKHAVRGADVAALFLSRRLLLDPRQDGPLSDVRHAAAGTLVLGAVEAAWHLHRRVIVRSSAAYAKLSKPLTAGLVGTRAVLWGAAFVLGISYTKDISYTFVNELALGPQAALLRALKRAAAAGEGAEEGERAGGGGEAAATPSEEGREELGTPPS